MLLPSEKRRIESARKIIQEYFNEFNSEVRQAEIVIEALSPFVRSFGADRPTEPYWAEKDDEELMRLFFKALSDRKKFSQLVAETDVLWDRTTIARHGLSWHGPLHGGVQPVRAWWQDARFRL